MTVSVSPAQGWVLYCRPGFERDCAQEAYIHALRQGAELRGSGALITAAGLVRALIVREAAGARLDRCNR